MKKNNFREEKRGLNSYRIINWNLTVAIGFISMFIFRILTCSAEVPRSTAYQGVLVDEAGSPLQGTVDLRIRFYDDATAGTVLFDEEHANIQLKNGVYAIQIGSGVVPGTANASGGLSENLVGISQLWLGVSVDGQEELTPRTNIGSVIFALKAEFAEKIVSVNSTNPGIVMDQANNVGIGTNNPTEKLSVSGTIESTSGGVKFPDGSLQATAAISIPIGTVIDWWRPDDSFPVPVNFQIADGSVVGDPESSLDGQTLPNLVDKFVLGIATPDQIGTAGGSANHMHNVDITHSHGEHSHVWSNYIGIDQLRHGYWRSYDSVGREVRILDRDEQVGIDADGDQPYGITRTRTQNSDNFYTDRRVVSLNADAQSNPISNLPPYVGLLKLVRIK